jgi:colanic acid/amylovoran biosynthesis glycosyltransferase
MAKVAYLMSRFPEITETFILYEMLEQERLGNTVEIYPLLRQYPPVVHPEAAAATLRAHFEPFVSAAILRANWHYLRRRPRAYFAAMAEVLRGTFGSPRFFLGALVFLPKSVRFAYQMERIGVTHMHAHFATHATLSAMIIHRLTGIPFSFTAHGHDVHCDRRMLGEKLAAAAFAITVCDYNRELMAREFGEHLRDKIHVIHCGVDTEYFRPPRELPPPMPLRIASVASLLEVKGHTYLVEACRLLREHGIAFHCDLVGEGDLKLQIEAQIAAAGLQDAFTLHGAQPRSEILRLLQQAHIKVLPSVPTSVGSREGIPVALMEAMACGLPVVSSRLSGIPELVEDGVSGILIEPRDAFALAQGIERLARDPDLRARMGAAGRRRVLRDFSLAANTARLSTLFGSARGCDSDWPSSLAVA